MSDLLTAQQFEEGLPDFPEGGRWHELSDGRVVMLQPPDFDHGNVVLNITKALGEWAAKTPTAGYACYELGLLVRRNPDTVICPAVSYFSVGDRFSESDKRVTDTCPQLIIELASTNDRRSGMRERILAYHEWGVDEVWVIDSVDKIIRLLPKGKASDSLSTNHLLRDRPVLPGFSVGVQQIFAEPEWWN